MSRSSSRVPRLLATDGRRGYHWVREAVVAHGLLLFAPFGIVGALRDRTYRDLLWLGPLWLAGACGTALFWWRARRVWRKLPDPVDPPVPPDPTDPPRPATVRRVV